jgi:hypothetical protein
MLFSVFFENLEINLSLANGQKNSGLQVSRCHETQTHEKNYLFAKLKRSNTSWAFAPLSKLLIGVM